MVRAVCEACGSILARNRHRSGCMGWTVAAPFFSVAG
jgi:hypothetical protein